MPFSVIAMGRIENLVVLVFISHLFSNSFMLLTSLLIFLESMFRDFPSCVIIWVMSSAYRMFMPLECWCGMSAVYSMYRVGDRQLPCRTPLIIGKEGSTRLFQEIEAVLLSMKLLSNLANIGGSCS